MARTTNERILNIWLVSLGLLMGLWMRCFWIQGVASRRYTAVLSAQHRLRTVLPAQRGTIYDRSGRPLALSVLAPSVFANARQIVAKRQTAERLAAIVPRDVTRIQRRLERDKGFVWIARQLEPEVASQVLDLKMVGLGMMEEPKRRYPHGHLAGHVVGVVNIDGRGLEGLEMTFNSLLHGQNGWRSTLRDAKGNILIGPWTAQSPPVNGLDIVLTIDSVVQQLTEEALAWGVKTYHAKGGSVVVMDPYTGAIFAMANWPVYDPNEPGRSLAEHRRNRAVTDLFEPGSIFKIVSAAALLEEGKVSPEENVFCEQGTYRTVAGHILHDHKPHGMLSFHDVIKFSSNIGVAKMAQRLSPEELYRYIRMFGFGQKTAIDVPGEVNGIIQPPTRWSKLSPFIIPIGQEIAATPIQLAVMTAVVANGGMRVRPYVVERIQSSDGSVIRVPSTEPPVRIIRESTAKILQGMLSSVVESGTGQLASVDGLQVAGKTGTAQKLEPTGSYSHSRFFASFVGFGPVPDSRFVIVVSIDEPRPLYFGGVVAAPIFKRIVNPLADYWDLRQVPSAPTLTQQSDPVTRKT